MDKKTINVAVLSQEFTQLIKDDNSHIIYLDEINISLTSFLQIFFPFGNNFAINKSILNNSNNNIYFPLISLQSQHRKIDKLPFYLFETILTNIETDLKMSRECFTEDSLIKFRSEFESIQSILDLNTCTLASSLTWTMIQKIIDDYPYDDQIVLVINIVFKTPTEGVKDNILKIQYAIK